MKTIILILLLSIYILPQSELLTLFDSGIRYAINENFSDGNYDGWTVVSGSYQVASATPLSGGTVALKCSTAGIISIPCTQAYGSWEFDFYATDAGQQNIDIINNSATAIDDGYNVLVSATETIFGIRKLNGGNSVIPLQTAVSYVAPLTWYRLKITRTSAGVFTFYIKGGAFGTASWTTVAGTTNPFTDTTFSVSTHFLLDIDANDMIANIQVYP